MKMLRNKKGFTLVELLAVIVVLAIVMGLAVVAITGVLDNARKSTFAADAKSFLEGAHSLVNADDMNNLLGTSGEGYAPKCVSAGDTTYIPIETIKLQQGGTKSPYGNAYQVGSATGAVNSAPGTSYVKVVSSLSGTECNYSFSIFLSDGVYAIGTQTAPKEEANVSADEVGVLGSGS